MRRLLRGPRRVLLTLLGVKRRRRYSNKNKYVAMLLKHDKQIKSMAKANMSQALECRIGELEDENKEIRSLVVKTIKDFHHVL